MSKKVLILYKYLPQWRVDFFNRLKDNLQNENVELALIYGKLKNSASKKNDEVDLVWGQYIPNKTLRIIGFDLIWQPVLKQILDSDLVIVEQANSLLINYVLLILRKFTNIKLAFWGHGLNMQDKPNSVTNKFKILYSSKCDWWFAYTKNVGNTIKSIGYPVDKITIVQNAIDTKYLIEKYERQKPEIIKIIKQKYNIGDGPIGLYCGGMYKEKRLDFLLQSCKIVRKEIPSFEVVFLGAGPEDYKIQEASIEHSWIHWMGPTFNEAKVPYFQMADVLLMPGLVGLAILDSFAMQTPIVTTNYQFHSPEIEYLVEGVNGLMTENNVGKYSDAIIQLLRNAPQIELLKHGCAESAQKYTVENMVHNFTEGIIKCLVS